MMTEVLIPVRDGTTIAAAVYAPQFRPTEFYAKQPPAISCLGAYDHE